MIRRALRVVLAIAGLAVASVVAILVHPQALFAHVVSAGRIEFHSDRHIDARAAAGIARDIEARIARSPLAVGAGPYRIFVANETWRRRLIWNVVASPLAGGITMYPLTGRSVFLSGADFPENVLIAGDGTRITPPRTLAYYGAHELTHVLTGEMLGAVRYLWLPVWIREGLADFVAFEPRQSFDELRAAIGARPDDLDVWKTFGFYAKYRLLVQYFIEVEGWSMENLLASGLSLADARTRMETATTETPGRAGARPR